MTLRALAAKSLPLIGAALLAGCASVESTAPPVPSLAVHSSASGSQRAQLEQGRTIYLTKCAKCHSPEPVRKYSASRWETILKDMLEETKLDPPEASAVRAYVFAALRG